jgi:hypothetical protein
LLARSFQHKCESHLRVKSLLWLWWGGTHHPRIYVQACPGHASLGKPDISEIACSSRGSATASRRRTGRYAAKHADPREDDRHQRRGDIPETHWNPAVAGTILGLLCRATKGSRRTECSDA